MLDGALPTTTIPRVQHPMLIMLTPKHRPVRIPCIGLQANLKPEISKVLTAYNNPLRAL